MDIFLKEVKLFGFHGVFEEEHRTGGYFLVDVTVRLQQLKQDWKLEDSIDYGAVFHILKKVFAQREILLETVAANICTQVFAQHAAAKEITVTITKPKAPIAGLDGQTGVSLHMERAVK